MATIINMTPHNIIIFAVADCEEVVKGAYRALIVKAGAQPALVIPPCGEVARAAEQRATLAPLSVEGVEIPLIEKTMGEPQGLPESQEGVFLLVSLATAKAAPGRQDLLVVGESVRSPEGQICGCISLAKP